MTSVAYNLIKASYALRVAERSQVPLINHIDEGLKIMSWHGMPSVDACDAFCLHPLLQDDEELYMNGNIVINTYGITSKSIMLCMEYRSVANEFLRDKTDNKRIEDIRLSPISEVNLMLVADKVQNRKDFELYHRDSHPFATELVVYFDMWLQRLGVTEDQYKEYVQRLIHG